MAPTLLIKVCYSLNALILFGVSREIPHIVPKCPPDVSSWQLFVTLCEGPWLAEVLLTLSGLHPQDVEAGSEATGDNDVADLDEADPLVILNQNYAQHSLESK